MVSTRRIRSLARLLLTVQIACLAGAPVAVWRLARVQQPPVDRSLPDRPVARTTSPVEKHDLAWYAPLWQRDLRQPPIPPVQDGAPKPAPSRPMPSVLATFVDHDRPLAHLIGQAGKPELLSLNDTLDGFTLVAIEPGRVQLESGSERRWVEMPKPKAIDP